MGCERELKPEPLIKGDVPLIKTSKTFQTEKQFSYLYYLKTPIEILHTENIILMSVPFIT